MLQDLCCEHPLCPISAISELQAEATVKKQRDARYAESQLCGMPFYHWSTGAQALRNGLKSARGRILKMRFLRFERENFLSFPSSFFVTSPFWYRGSSGPQTIPEILQCRDVGMLSGGLLFRPGTGRTLEEE